MEEGAKTPIEGENLGRQKQGVSQGIRGKLGKKGKGGSFFAIVFVIL